MKDFSRKFEEFGTMLEELYPKSPFTFEEACRRLDVPEPEFNDFVFSKTGLSGPEVLTVYSF